MSGSLEPPEVGRYARHLILAEIGKTGQESLKQARVLIVGIGGLGSPAALYLAAAGVGTIGLMDDDQVDASNLHRQVLYGDVDVGRSKVTVAAERLKAVNPFTEIVEHEVRLTSDNALELFEPYDIILDGTDNFPTRYLVNDACVLLGKPNVYASILKWEGQLSVFATEEGPCYRCLFREPPPPGSVPNCAEAGVIGALPGVMGSLQGLETVKLLTGAGRPMTGRLLLYDALETSWREIEVRRNPECPVCGDQPSQAELIDYELFCGVEGDESTEEVTREELQQRLFRGEEVCLIDVRESWEWEAGNLSELGAIHIPLGEVSSRFGDFPSDREIVVYCKMGGRSARAAAALREAGFGRVLSLVGGYDGWEG